MLLNTKEKIMSGQEISTLKSKMYSDTPIKGATRFNFKAYSEVISKIILNKENKTPFTIAINGKWGRGKTTLMRTIREELETKSGLNENRKIKTVWFDAWKYPETDSMLSALVLEIFEEMERHGTIKKLKSKMVGGKEINILQEVSDLAKVLTGGLVEIEKWFENPAYKEKLSFYDLFQDYIKKILITFVLEKEDGEYSDKEGVLVIFIDDLDRCPPQNIRKILESINLFFDKEGCFFIFGTDISLISKAIDSEYKDLDGFSGIDYIKKMVQLQFDLPEIHEEDIKEFVEKELEIEDELKTYFNIILGGLESNQREIKRFLNSLNLMRMLGESTDIPGYEEELLIKWSVLSLSSKKFVKEVNRIPNLLIKLQELSDKDGNEVEEYIESLDEKYKNLCNEFRKETQIIEVLKTGNKRFTEDDIHNYVFLSSYAPKEPEEKIELKIGPGADLAGADLREANLWGADLAGADLREADLWGASLARASLARADLVGASLARADLTGANLRGANLMGANLMEANLRDANLRGADLREANLRGANLMGANLMEANLRDANLRGADLREANLRGAIIDDKCLETILTSRYWETANFDYDAIEKLRSMDQTKN